MDSRITATKINHRKKTTEGNSGRNTETKDELHEAIQAGNVIKFNSKPENFNKTARFISPSFQDPNISNL